MQYKSLGGEGLDTFELFNTELEGHVPIRRKCADAPTGASQWRRWLPIL